MITTIMISLVLLGAVVLSGCTTPEEDATTMTELNIGYQPSTHQIAHMTAMENGWWQEDLSSYGIETINDYEFPTGAPEMHSMLAGDLDIAYVGAAPVISAISSGLDAKIVASVNTQGSDLVLHPDLVYEGPEDLKGLTIATFPPGTIQDTLLKNWLIENGLDPDVDVDIKGMGPGDAMTAMASGQIDGAFLPHPAPTLIANEGNGRSVLASGEIMENHACCVLVVSGDLIRNHPDMVDQIVKTHIRATEYNFNNMDEAAQIFATKMSWDVETVKTSLQEWDGIWSANPHPVVDSTVNYAQVQYDLEYVDTELTEEDIFDLSFYDTAVAE
ncbi:MAG: ABC transporter substrate-binding protein [Methanosarcinaceae archaeon]|nr:ABC transporter substrate-binding protein [Methanosarcinaceae archaeon]